MLFNSFEFVAFAPIALLGAAVLRGLPFRLWLLVLSYIFYGWGEPWYCILLLASTVLDYFVALGIDAAQDPSRRRWLLMLSLAGNLGLLAVFKYAAFVVQFYNAAVGTMGLAALAMKVPELPLPVGISFYTFQTLSYTIDVYRGRMPAQRDFTTMALYVAFFPQLVAGPIERADRLMHQIQDRRPRDADDVLAGVTRILWGLLKKVVFADWLAVYVNMAYGHPNAATPWDLLLATYAFAFQIYLDFSAYSDIAIGLSRTMGVKLVENFRWPYLSRNVGEFWRRWHISLSTWLRDYLYIPLGGSRRGMARTASNVIIVMFLGGLWHGADWKFAVWGLYIGLALAVHHAWARWRGTRVDENTPFAWRQAPAILLTFHVILVSWVFFRAESMGSALRIFERLGELRLPMTFNWPEADVARPAIILLLAALAHLLRGLGLTQRLAQVRSPVAVGALWGVMIVLIALLFAPIRARFIYFQF